MNATEQTIDDLLADLRSRKKVTNYKDVVANLQKNYQQKGKFQTLPYANPQKATPQLGDDVCPGGFALIDQKHNLVDIWNELNEKEACEKFNKMYDEWLAGKDLPEKVFGQVWLIGVTSEGESAGVLGYMGGERP